MSYNLSNDNRVVVIVGMLSQLRSGRKCTISFVLYLGRDRPHCLGLISWLACQNSNSPWKLYSYGSILPVNTESFVD